MRRGGLGDIMIWVALLVVFGPFAALALTDSLDVMVTQLSPYSGLAGVVLLAVLALRMFFR